MAHQRIPVDAGLLSHSCRGSRRPVRLPARDAPWLDRVCRRVGGLRSESAAGWLIAARLAQGTGTALILAGGIAILRAAYQEEMERTKTSAMAAGAAGLASAVGGARILGRVAWSQRAEIAVMMLFCDRFGQLAASRATRMRIMLGALLSASGIFWLTVGPYPLPFWSYVVPGTTLFGTGLAMAVGPLTHEAISSLPAREAGSASGMHHATVRAAGLVAIAALGTIAAGDG